jgi:hypothetical protein
MEEQKSKEVKMNVAKRQNQGKLSYDELNRACAELSQQVQNQQAYMQRAAQEIQEMSMVLRSRRMDYLFNAVGLATKMEENHSEYGFDKAFVDTCIQEIQETLTITPEEKSEDKQEN